VPIAIGAGVGIGLSVLGSPHAHPVRSSDVAACDLLSAAQVVNLLHAPLAEPPSPTTTDVQATGFDFSRNGGPYTVTKHVKNLDTCQYRVQGTGLGSLRTEVVPVGQVALGEVFSSASTHAKHGTLTYFPLSGVGDRAALVRADLGATDLKSQAVYFRRGAWAAQVIAVNVDERTTIGLARTLANAPRLERPPAPVTP
jgi:hypothetical protein